MKIKLLGGIGLIATLLALGLICMVGVKAQSAAHLSNAPLTTNWVGCLVVGKKDAFDQIGRSAYPTAVQQVELGLRSDGVIVWRDAPAK